MRLRRLTALTLVAMFAAAPGHANELRIHLSATVPTLCSVTEVRTVDAAAGLMQIDASCNAAAFQLVLGGDLAGLPLQSASAAQASVSVQGNTVSVRPQRPGSFTFNLRYEADLGDIRSAFAQIESR